MFLLVLFISYSLAVRPTSYYQFKHYNDADDEMLEMYSMDRTVQLYEIRVRRTQYKINCLKDEVNAPSIPLVLKVADRKRIKMLERVLADYKKELHENAQECVKFFNGMSASAKKQFNSLYAYKKRFAEIQRL